ncbi:MAG: glycosyltransferase, partial [Acidimicrobiales bacterium]|nr:glycosyltransferase [Acidimicrobiales bacterium]
GAWLTQAGALLANPQVAAVAPRVRSGASSGPVRRWGQVRPALDLGPKRSAVRPRTRVPYVPTAALVVRRDALEAVDGFNDRMLLGEDVDLVWRLHDAGWTIRYEPDLVVEHRVRPNLRRWILQRFRYGRSNAVLAEAHHQHVAALELTSWNAVLMLGLAPWRPARAAAAVAAAAGPIVLRARLANRCEHPGRMALILQRDGVLYALDATAQALRRSYWPVVAVSSIQSRRARWLSLATVGAAMIRWLVQGRPVPLHRWLAAGAADDLAFGAGVWWESLRRRSFRALRLHLSRLDRFLPDDIPPVTRQ